MSDQPQTTAYRLEDEELVRVLQNGGNPAVPAAEAAINKAIISERSRCAQRAYDAMRHGTFNQRVLDAIRNALHD